MGYNRWYPNLSGFIGVEGHFLQYPLFFSHRHSYGIEHLQLRTEYVYIIVYIYILLYIYVNICDLDDLPTLKMVVFFHDYVSLPERRCIV